MHNKVHYNKVCQNHSSNLIPLAGIEHVWYIKLEKLCLVNLQSATLKAGIELKIPNISSNLMVVLRNETVGGIAIVTLGSNGTVVPSAGNSNFIEGHNYSGSFAYITA